ncbi:MAG TPA: hypothetical protein VF792_07375 [Ktedonobacterales bacterium]
MTAQETPSYAHSPRFNDMSRYSMIFGVALVGVTLVALILAFFSSDFQPQGAHSVPASWSQVYNADLTGLNDSAWDETSGCSFTALGLDAVSSGATSGQCVFLPSVKQSVTAHGFFFQTQLAPASKISAFARYAISVGAVGDNAATDGGLIHFIVGQDGKYILCDGVCVQGTSAIYQQGGLAAWHGDALLTNTLAIKVSPDHTMLSVFVNDQQIASVSTQLGPTPTIAVGTVSTSEAIFTHATLYAGN